MGLIAAVPPVMGGPWAVTVFMACHVRHPHCEPQFLSLLRLVLNKC